MIASSFSALNKCSSGTEVTVFNTEVYHYEFPKQVAHFRCRTAIILSGKELSSTE